MHNISYIKKRWWSQPLFWYIATLNAKDMIYRGGSDHFIKSSPLIIEKNQNTGKTLKCMLRIAMDFFNVNKYIKCSICYTKTENNTQIGTITKSNIKIVDCSISCLTMGTKPALVKWRAKQVLSMCK
jgi:hypothetical protein